VNHVEESEDHESHEPRESRESQELREREKERLKGAELRSPCSHSELILLHDSPDSADSLDS
jgi:hypothetical protein